MVDANLYERLGEVVCRIDARYRLLRAWTLLGGVSAQVVALEAERSDGAVRRLVFRWHGETDLKQDPLVAAHEYRVLQTVREAGIAAPTPLFLDESNDLFPTPYLVVEYVKGESNIAQGDVLKAVDQMADYMACVHTIKESNADLSFLQDKTQSVIGRLVSRPARLDTGLHEGLIRDALEAALPVAHVNDRVLLHGDFWPGNVLWQDGYLAAVIDWEDAGVGDPLADLANARLEFLWAYGESAMHRFTDCYVNRTQVDVSKLPFWDLYAALRPIVNLDNWGLESERLRSMRLLHRQFAARALALIG